MQEKEMTQEELIRRFLEQINQLDKELREDAAEIATLRKTISEQAAIIERLKSKAELFDQLTRIE
jgi:hypothetical protein